MLEAQSHLPLSPLSFHILLALAHEAAHGYGIAKQVEERSEGRFKPTTGSLYRGLRRLVADGLVEHAPEAQKDSPDSRRHYFRITALGRRVATLEAQRLHGLLLTARSLDLIGDPA
jgi:DNA-binding PadR family transcriptional regulator